MIGNLSLRENNSKFTELDICKEIFNCEYKVKIINPLTSPGEVVSVFTSPYLSAGAPALGESKGLMNDNREVFKNINKYYVTDYISNSNK